MKTKPTKKVAKKATVKKQPAKKVAPAKKQAVKVKVLTFEPDEVLQLKEHIADLKEVATKLRKRNKSLQETIVELKAKLASKKENDFLKGVDTGLGTAVLPTRVVIPSSPFNGNPEVAPVVPSSSRAEETTPAVSVSWQKADPFNLPAPPVAPKGLLGNVCAVKY